MAATVNTSTINDLRDALALGFGMVTRVWEYRTKDWVTSVFAADIDNDGEVEVVLCSRDGRVHLLTRNGDRRWEHVVGAKAWVGTGIISGFPKEARIVVGTRDGKVYMLDKDGTIIPKEKNLPLHALDSFVNENDKAEEEYWLNTDYVIRQVYVDPDEPSTVIIGSEDRCAYGLNYENGEQRWKFQTSGWVRAVFSYDIDSDGSAEVLVGSLDNFLYLLDAEGHELAKHDMKFPVHTLFAADIDLDGRVEILVGTDAKDLTALTFDPACGFTQKWHHSYNNRLLSLCVADIDKDGQIEIIAGSEDKHIYILDASGRVIWRHNHKFRVYSIYPCDIDKDGLPELLVGSDNNIVRALRVRLRKGVDKKIRKYYKSLGEPEPHTITQLTANERELLQDMLETSEKKEPVTLKQAKDLMGKGHFVEALSILCKLEQQKVERVWRRDTSGHIRTVCLRQVSGEHRREIIVGTSEGNVLAYNAHARNMWSTPLEDRIIDVQTGYIDHKRQEEIVICSSDRHIYILSGAKKPEKRKTHLDTYMSSICVAAPNSQNQAEIIIGSEDKKLYIYGSDLQSPIETIETNEGIRIVRTYSSGEDHQLEIVAGSLGQRVYAFTRYGKPLWFYDAHDHIRTVCLRDINGDGKAEVLVGSEDRNVHVLDSNGHLLWRYYLPHSVLSVDAADANHDNKVEIFVGCSDGYLYVFNKDGEFQWQYQAKDRIHAVRVEDIDDDGEVEIVLGSEDELELLRVVNQKAIHNLVSQCWAALCKDQDASQLIESLLGTPDSFLQSFALGKFFESDSFSPTDFDVFDQFTKTDVIEVRKTLARLVLEHFQVNPASAGQLLRKLSVDPEPDVRNAIVEYLSTLMKHDWETGLFYFQRFSENDNRHVRRLVMRKLYQLIDAPLEIPIESQRKIFDLLLAAVQYKDSEWICQEAARTLAHFLDHYHGRLIVNVQMLIVKEVKLPLLQSIAYTVTMPVVKQYLNAVIPMLSDLNEDNVLEKTQHFVKGLEGASTLIFGKDLYSIYTELYRLLSVNSIDEIAHYQYPLSESQFAPDNEFARIILDIFEELGSISRILRIYLRRQGLQDRLSSLLEAISAIDKATRFLEQRFTLQLLGEPLSKLPNHQVFILLLHRWREMVRTQLNELRGKAELKAELQTKLTRYEDQVCVWLNVRNTGRSTASNVKIALLHNDNFSVVGEGSLEIEVIPPQEERIAEFIIKPLKTILELHFEIVFYGDSDQDMKVEECIDRLELSDSLKEFRYIPNPYSTGTPTHDNKMFYGRDADMQFLQDNLTRDSKAVIVLYGQRRSGKTTILLQLMSTRAFGEHIPVLIDMQRVSYHMTIHNFLYRVAYYIAQALQKSGIAFDEPQPENFDAVPTHAFDIFLDRVEEKLARRKLILLVDEFEILEDQVTNKILEPQIFEYLRDILQHRQNINFLFSGTHKITDYTKWYRSVFFNIAHHHPLSRLSSQGAEDLIQQPVAGYLEYDPLTVTKIRQLTFDQPYLIHLMCRAIVDYCNDRRKTYVALNDVNIVLREVMQTIHFHFDWLWDQISPEERVALSALAAGGKEDGRWLTLDEIFELFQRYHLPIKREALLVNLRTLVDADIVESNSNDYWGTMLDSSRFRVPVGLTRRWLIRAWPLELARKEMSG